jgi:uncharacterized protein (DUF2141 family)
MKLRGFFFVLICFIAQQCAKQTAPTGGPKDEIPPTLEKSYPKHEQTNVKGSLIELTFDERIQLNNPREQIIITPSVGKKFETTFNKNKVILDLKTELKPNTTYNINFREAIQDLSEKNPAIVKLAFSTGDYIDSLSINGKITDALSEKPSASYMVALAEASDTFNIFKHPAQWLTQTDKTGFYSLENLKPGNYIIYAFEDKSKNMIVDSKSERYGIVSETIQLEKNIDSLRIRTFKLDVTPLKLITARTTFAYFNLRFSKGLVNYTVTAPQDSTETIYATLEPDFTTIKIYNTIPTLDSLQIRVQASDSLNNKADTVLYMKFPKKEATKDKFSAKIEKVNIEESNSILTSKVIFTKPIITFAPDSMYLEIDSLTKITFAPADYTWNKQHNILTFRKLVDQNMIYPKDTSTVTKTVQPKGESGNKNKQPAKKEKALVLKKGAFISVENDTSATLTSPLTLIKTESTAIIETKVVTKENFVLQLLDQKLSVVHERVNEKESKFENLTPQTYLIRLIIDTNNNGKWDAGSFENRTEPEPIIYYRSIKGIKDIPTKANWYLGPLLITY